VVADTLLGWGSPAWRYFVRNKGGADTALDWLDDTWTGYYGNKYSKPLRINATSAAPAGDAANPLRAVWRYTAPVAQAIDLRGCFAKTASGDGVDLTVLRNGKAVWQGVLTTTCNPARWPWTWPRATSSISSPGRTRPSAAMRSSIAWCCSGGAERGRDLPQLIRALAGREVGHAAGGEHFDRLGQHLPAHRPFTQRGRDRHVPDLAHHVHARDNVTERGIAQLTIGIGIGRVGIQAGHVGQQDREIRRGRARRQSGQRERARLVQDAGLAGGFMRHRLEQLGTIADAALQQAIGLLPPFQVHGAVERHAVIALAVHVMQEIAHADRGVLPVQLHHDGALAGNQRDSGDIGHGSRCGRGLGCGRAGGDLACRRGVGRRQDEVGGGKAQGHTAGQRSESDSHARILPDPGAAGKSCAAQHG
jgi:hypothetical protein